MRDNFVVAAIAFLDTEFTDLRSPELLSLGLVTLDGREHYAELDLTTGAGRARVASASDFVRHGGILGMWGIVPDASATEWGIGRRTADWLITLARESGEPVSIAFDYSVDYALLEDVIRDCGAWEEVGPVVRPSTSASAPGPGPGCWLPRTATARSRHAACGAITRSPTHSR